MLLCRAAGRRGHGDPAPLPPPHPTTSPTLAPRFPHRGVADPRQPRGHRDPPGPSRRNPRILVDAATRHERLPPGRVHRPARRLGAGLPGLRPGCEMAANRERPRGPGDGHRNGAARIPPTHVAARPAIGGRGVSRLAADPVRGRGYRQRPRRGPDRPTVPKRRHRRDLDRRGHPPGGRGERQTRTTTAPHPPPAHPCPAESGAPLEHPPPPTPPPGPPSSPPSPPSPPATPTSTATSTTASTASASTASRDHGATSAIPASPRAPVISTSPSPTAHSAT